MPHLRVYSAVRGYGTSDKMYYVNYTYTGRCNYSIGVELHAAARHAKGGLGGSRGSPTPMVQ